MRISRTPFDNTALITHDFRSASSPIPGAIPARLLEARSQKLCWRLILRKTALLRYSIFCLRECCMWFVLGQVRTMRDVVNYILQCGWVRVDSLPTIERVGRANSTPMVEGRGSRVRTPRMSAQERRIGNSPQLYIQTWPRFNLVHLQATLTQLPHSSPTTTSKQWRRPTSNQADRGDGSAESIVSSRLLSSVRTRRPRQAQTLLRTAAQRIADSP